MEMNGGLNSTERERERERIFFFPSLDQMCTTHQKITTASLSLSLFLSLSLSFSLSFSFFRSHWEVLSGQKTDRTLVSKGENCWFNVCICSERERERERIERERENRKRERERREKKRERVQYFLRSKKLLDRVNNTILILFFCSLDQKVWREGESKLTSGHSLTIGEKN